MVRKVALAILAMVAALTANAPSAAAIDPHENPDSAPWVFDGVSLLSKYSEALDSVLGRDAAGVRILQEQASQANIPSELGNTVANFLSSSHSLADLIPEIESYLEMSSRMLEQFRTDEAGASAAATKENLTRAYDQLEVMERETKVTGGWWKADSAKEGSALGDAYQGVLDRLEELRRLLDLLSPRYTYLAEQNAIVAVPLRPTALNLWVEPSSAFVGDTLEFGGELFSQGHPLPGRKVVIFLGGTPVSEEVTDSKGIYRGHIRLPYRYVSKMPLQAIYYPRGDDVGLYLGSSSPEVIVKVLYYLTGLKLEVPQNAYPGRSFVLKGQFDYGDSPVPEGRSLQVYWDGSQVAEKTVDTSTFTLEFEVAPETKPGKHRLAVYVSPDKRYSRAGAGAHVEVVKLTPAIEFDAPAVALLPLAQDIPGRVYSSLGPLQQALVEISLGDWETTTRTGSEGTFQARLSTGLSLTLVGSQALQVSVTPTEPWHKATFSTVELLMINPANMVGLVLVLAISVLLAVRQWRRRPSPLTAPVASQPSTPLVGKENHPRKPELLKPEGQGNPQAILVTLYRGVLKLVQELTAVLLRKNHTLREYAQECAPKLGPLAAYFQELTDIIEKTLYARQHTGQADAVRGTKLTRKLLEGAEHEDN